MRQSHEDPPAVARLGWRYHHLGIPHSTPRDGEMHLQQLGVHVCGFETSMYGIEWMRFEAHCRVPEIVKTAPHLAFAVDNLDAELGVWTAVLSLRRMRAAGRRLARPKSNTLA